MLSKIKFSIIYKIIFTNCWNHHARSNDHSASFVKKGTQILLHTVYYPEFSFSDNNLFWVKNRCLSRQGYKNEMHIKKSQFLNNLLPQTLESFNYVRMHKSSESCWEILGKTLNKWTMSQNYDTNKIFFKKLLEIFEPALFSRSSTNHQEMPRALPFCVV